MLNKFKILGILLLVVFVGSDVPATTKNIELIKQNWPFNGIFGRFDKSSLQRGFKVYKEICAACHGIRHISYRDLAGIGYSEDEIKILKKNQYG